MSNEQPKNTGSLSQIEKAVRSLKLAIQDCECALAILYNTEGHDKALTYIELATCEILWTKAKINESLDTNPKSTKSSDEGGRGNARGMVDGGI